MRAERKWRGARSARGAGRVGGGGKVTEMLKDERGGGEIISHYKLWGKRDRPRRRQCRGEPVQPVQNFLMRCCAFNSFSPFLQQPNKPRNTMKMTLKENCRVWMRNNATYKKKGEAGGGLAEWEREAGE